MKSIKGRLLAALTAAALTAGALFVPATAADSLEQNIANTQGFFREKHSAPIWLFQQVKEKGSGSLTLSDDFYAVEFQSGDIGPLNDKLQRYDLNMVRLTSDKELKAANEAVGEKTPKYLLRISDGENFPGKATFTLLDCHFRPNSTLHVYEAHEDGTFTHLQDTTVSMDKKASFTVSKGGDYLVTARKVGEKLPMFNFERPTLTELTELLSFSDVDTQNQYLLGEITTWEEYFANYEEPDFPYDIEYDYLEEGLSYSYDLDHWSNRKP